MYSKRIVKKLIKRKFWNDKLTKWFNGSKAHDFKFEVLLPCVCKTVKIIIIK